VSLPGVPNLGRYGPNKFGSPEGRYGPNKFGSPEGRYGPNKFGSPEGRYGPNKFGSPEALVARCLLNRGQAADKE